MKLEVENVFPTGLMARGLFSFFHVKSGNVHRYVPICGTTCLVPGFLKCGRNIPRTYWGGAPEIRGRWGENTENTGMNDGRKRLTLRQSNHSQACKIYKNPENRRGKKKYAPPYVFCEAGGGLLAH